MHTVPFKLNKPANSFQAGDSTGFGIRCGIKCKNPKTQVEEWTNYSAVIFAKSQAQIDFYTRTLVEGTMAVVSGEKLLVDQFDGQSGLVITLSLLNARLEAVHTQDGQQPAQRQQQAPPQRQPAPQPQGGMDSFDDDLPF